MLQFLKVLCRTNWERDTEAHNLWKAILPEDRILLGSKKDNFWEMGEQGLLRSLFGNSH